MQHTRSSSFILRSYSSGVSSGVQNSGCALPFGKKTREPLQQLPRPTPKAIVHCAQDFADRALGEAATTVTIDNLTGCGTDPILALYGLELSYINGLFFSRAHETKIEFVRSFAKMLIRASEQAI